VGRLAFLLGKRFERSNIISADAFNELEEKLALLLIIELIKVFHFALGRVGAGLSHTLAVSR
jgi:hypothetical protein